MISTSQLNFERTTVISKKSFEEVTSLLEKEISQPDMATFTKKISDKNITYSELKKTFEDAVGEKDFMLFMALDLGGVLQLENNSDHPKIKRYIMGNALIMKEMTKYDPNAGSYAPVTVLIDERKDGVYLSYDRMASFIAHNGNENALSTARKLDEKVENLMLKIAK